MAEHPCPQCFGTPVFRVAIDDLTDSKVERYPDQPFTVEPLTISTPTWRPNRLFAS